MRPDPEFAVHAVGEELGLSAIVFGDEKQAAMGRAVRLHNQQAAGFTAAHEVRKIAGGTVAEIGVVRADLFAAGRNQEVLARIRPR